MAQRQYKHQEEAVIIYWPHHEKLKTEALSLPTFGYGLSDSIKQDMTRLGNSVQVYLYRQHKQTDKDGFKRRSRGNVNRLEVGYQGHVSILKTREEVEDTGNPDYVNRGRISVLATEVNKDCDVKKEF